MHIGLDLHLTSHAFVATCFDEVKKKKTLVLTVETTNDLCTDEILAAKTLLFSYCSVLDHKLFYLNN
jgi:hypothetical protein